jgi:polyisoprenoid-binding protein YceI
MELATATRTFGIDKAHSEVMFRVRHLVTHVRGRFSDFDGVLEFDEARPEQSRISFTVQAASIDTNQADRDRHLRSEDFFFAERFPTLTFASTGVHRVGTNRFRVSGDLTIRDVSRPIALDVSYLGMATDPWGNLKAGFEAEATLNRRDFGLTWNAALETGGFLLGDEVKVMLAIQAQAKPAV